MTPPPNILHPSAVPELFSKESRLITACTAELSDDLDLSDYLENFKRKKVP
jgi:hypothetical protein